MAKQTFTTGQVLTAAQMTSLQQTAMGGGSTTAKTASYVLVAADAGTVVQMNSASATTITVNTALFAAGDTVEIQNVGAGVCTVTAGTATVSTSSVLTLQQYDAGSLYFNSTSAAIFFASDAANSPLTTKGDLFTYSTSDTRLAAGSNGETLVADSVASTGLRYQSAYNGNGIINGGMDIWQRGTSFAFTSPGVAYTADRWLGRHLGTNVTYSQQTSGLTGIQYGLRIQRPVSTTGVNDQQIYYQFETPDSYRFAGQTVTLSFYAKAGANFSATSSIMSSAIYSGTGTNQNITSGAYTGQATVVSQNNTLTTSYQRFSVTGTVGATATQIAIILSATPTGTAGANDWYEITGVQLEFGSVATSFKRSAGGNIQGELAACQRYYFRSTSDATTPVAIYANGTGTAATSGRFGIQLPVTMRTTPTSLDYANLGMSDSVNAATAVTVLALATNLTWNNVCGLNATTASGITTYRPYFLVANSSANAYVGLSAEL